MLTLSNIMIFPQMQRLEQIMINLSGAPPNKRHRRPYSQEEHQTQEKSQTMGEILQASKITKMDKSKQLKESKQSKERKSNSGARAPRLLPEQQASLLVIRRVPTTMMKQQASPMRVLEKSRKKNKP